MTDYTFSELADILTSETYGAVDHDDGPRIYKGNGLLQQLREAVFGGMESGGGSSFGSKLPMDSDALDLLELITEQAASVLAVVDPRPTPLGQAEQYVRLWSAVTNETTVFRVRVSGGSREFTAFGLLRYWVSAVERFFSPRSSSPVPAPCPAEGCGERHVQSGEGESARILSALNVEREGSEKRLLGVRCSACGAWWDREDLPRLSESLGFAPDHELVAQLLGQTN